MTLPRITGRAIKGIPAGSRWFVPIDERCVVPSTDGRVFAAGDATDFPVKQGGIGAQQADAAAAGIAHLAGVGDRPPALNPVLRGALLTGTRPLYLASRVIDGLGWHTEIYEQPPWPAEEKIVAEELGSYLRLRPRGGCPAPPMRLGASRSSRGVGISQIDRGRLLERASQLDPVEVRSLEAIHLPRAAWPSVRLSSLDPGFGHVQMTLTATVNAAARLWAPPNLGATVTAVR